jgi:hypothetical protein
MFYNRYQSNNVILDSQKKRRYVQASILPTIEKTSEDTYIITTIGDRLDSLAHEYYKDASKWFLIASANPDLQISSLYLEPGIQLRIPPITFPSDVDRIIEETNNR